MRIKSTAFLFLLIALISCHKSEVSPPVEIFTNTSVEDGTNSPTGWWLVANGTGAAFSWTNATASSGTHSLEITSTKALTDLVYWGQSVTQNIPKGKNLILKLKIKGAISIGSGAVAIACLNATSTTNAQQFSTTQGSQSMEGTFDWKSYTIQLSGVHNDITEIRVYLMFLPGASGEIYFDDIQLTAQ